MRLLDLTARNPLINFRHPKRGCLRIIDELPDQLVETLLDGTEMRFRPVPDPTEKELIEGGYLRFDEETQQTIRLLDDPTAEEWAKHCGLDISYEVPASAPGEAPRKHTDKDIQTLLFPHEMESRLRTLYRTAELAIQEMGANILYLAFGFLEWYESPSSDSARRAPLFLVPIRLHKGKLNKRTRIYEYTLSYSGEDIIPNLSLREKLRADFALALPDLGENTPEEYFREVQTTVESTQPRWRIRRYVSLARLNFSKLLMYLDLDPARWPENSNICDHPVASCFLAGGEQESKTEDAPVGDAGFGEEYDIDEIENIHTDYPLIDNADSSQHSVLIDAVSGKNLVIEGPPGTGKSQTITNLISAAMAQGKKVLFVAEKLAALEVVRSRLDIVGLGEFCLELHSHKSQKRRLLDEVDKRLKKHGRYRKPEEIELDISRYEELKTALKTYAENINRPWKNTGNTPHEIFMAAARYRNAVRRIDLNAIGPDGYDGHSYDLASQRRNGDHVKIYRRVCQAVEDQLGEASALQDHPWYGVRNGDLQMYDQDGVQQSLDAWQAVLRQLDRQIEAIAETLHCQPSDVAGTLSELVDLGDQLGRMSALKGDEILEKLPYLRGNVLEEAQGFLTLTVEIQEGYATLAEQVDEEVLQDPALIDDLLVSGKQIGKLIRQDVRFEHLPQAMNRLATIRDQLEQFIEPLRNVSQILGEPAAEHLNLSKSGLLEFKTLIELVSTLPPSQWKYRDPLFDNEELDELLPQLCGEIDGLKKLRDSVYGVFSLEELPAEKEIRKLQNSLTSGGLFGWLKKDWRKARKQVMGYATDSSVQFSRMLPLLGDLAEFVGKLRRLEENAHFREALGDWLQGLDTDLNALQAVRAWYREIRRQYGFGFGARAPLGNALIEFPSGTAKAIRSLSEQNVQTQVDELIDGLSDLQEAFPSISELFASSAQLIGEEGSVPRLLEDIRAAVQACGCLAEGDSLTIKDLAERVEQIALWKCKFEEWQKTHAKQNLLEEPLDLCVGVDQNHAADLSPLYNTLELATYLDTQLDNKKLAEHIYSNPDRSTFATLAGHLEDLRATLSDQTKCYKAFRTAVQLNHEQWTTPCGEHIRKLISRNQKALDHGEMLMNWLDYVRVRNELESFGLAKLVEAVEANKISVQQIEDAYQAGIFNQLAREVLMENSDLQRFYGHVQESRQEQFREYDQKLMELQCEQIAWKIDQTEIPVGIQGVRASERSEKILLEHECTKTRRHIPIRQLLQRAGGALAALKPCFMMGPMSVAQYLAPGKISFDLVVMDEASQIKPQDALGAITRGTQLVVVGDSKQLPPTSFFDKVSSEEDEDPTVIEESESILDSARSMFPARRLRWHYRSQHESLIAFSNHFFYQNDLILFPSPHKETETHGIQFSRVRHGCFVNRRNMEEAKIVSEAVREHFRHRPEETLGVVAMNAEQRQQIEQAIETLAKGDIVFQEQLDRDADRHESFFIKNLENVQGDERDVIFISMTYGPSGPDARVFQRFGPINSDTGWRRLNVLFTRSKKRMHIFSSMGSDDVLVEPKSKRGVQALHDFLKYCETKILHETKRNTGREPDSDFEIAVMEALNDAGFECIPQVGVAGFFIDLAVLDPGRPSHYLMGIECDGATYHSAKSTRDRDRLRQTILERLGWKIGRIWSTDWFKNPRNALKPIIEELRTLKSLPKLADESVEAEAEGIQSLMRDIETHEAQVEPFAYGQVGLDEKLIQFSEDVISKEFPDTPLGKRLLRPAMREALLEYRPTSQVEFLELVPSYIREATEAAENKYLGLHGFVWNTCEESILTQNPKGMPPCLGKVLFSRARQAWKGGLCLYFWMRPDADEQVGQAWKCCGGSSPSATKRSAHECHLPH